MPTKDGLTTYSDLLRANERFDRARLRYEAALKRWATVAEKRLRDAPAITAQILPAMTPADIRENGLVDEEQ